MFWSFVTTSWDILWYMWLLIRLPKLLLNFCGKDTSQSSEHQPSSWVTKGPTLRATSSASCVSSWAFRKQELCHTTPRLMDRWIKLTKCWYRWLENWVKIRRQTGLKHLLEMVHAYNSMRSAITRYSPHHLRFGQWPCLPIDFYFPTIMITEKHQHVNHYVGDLCEQLHEAFKEVQVQSTSEA